MFTGKQFHITKQKKKNSGSTGKQHALWCVRSVALYQKNKQKKITGLVAFGAKPVPLEVRQKSIRNCGLCMLSHESCAAPSGRDT